MSRVDTPFRRLLKRIENVERGIADLIVKTARSEVTGGVSRRATADLPTVDIAGQIYYVTDAINPGNTAGDLMYNNGASFISVHSMASIAEFTVAGLPPGGSHQNIAIATDGRKAGEGVGAGTGVLCWYDPPNWRTSYDNTVVVA